MRVYLLLTVVRSWWFVNEEFVVNVHDDSIARFIDAYVLTGGYHREASGIPGRCWYPSHQYRSRGDRKPLHASLAWAVRAGNCRGLLEIFE